MQQESINSPQKGMQFDLNPSNFKETDYSFALNARQESEDGNLYNLTNEPSTTLATDTFPEGYKVIGTLNIVEQNRTIYWLANPTSNQSEIGFISNSTDGCEDTLNKINPPDTGNPIFFEPSELSLLPCNRYNTIVNDPCLNFSVDHPIRSAEYKLTNNTTEVYFTDKFNNPRFIDLDNLPITGGSLDCNLTKIFPDFDVPEINVVEIQDTGSLRVGSYQFLVAYSNSLGALLSQWYSPTNPVAIWENKQSSDLSFETSKAININISNIDVSRTYLDIAVVKTINFTQTFEVVGTFAIVGDVFNYTYTGNNKTPVLLTREELYARSPYYKTAGTLTSQNRILMLGDLTSEPRINYQSVASKIKLYWETWRLPYNSFQAYNNGANTANIRGYMRDEVYPFEAVFVEKTGRVSDRFTIPGRIGRPSDFTPVLNNDAINSSPDPCDPAEAQPYWKVYNTATILGSTTSSDPCYIGPWQWGEMAYWESTERYPNNVDIWGPLANQLIRHHKFPDSTITHIHDNNPSNDINYEHSVYPIGIKFDLVNILQAIADSDLTPEQKANIESIRIVRGNRRVNKSIQAKGLIFNVGSYQFQGQEFLYPNYPFNDLNKDVFLSTERLDPITGLYTSAAAPYSGASPAVQLDGFSGLDAQRRYSFISPDTSFIHPSLSGSLKLETIEFGKTNSHIIKVQDNPTYEIGTQKGVKMAVVLALTTILVYKVNINTTTGVDLGMDINFQNFLPAFAAAYDLINKLVPFEQYGYQYNGVGNYCQFIPVANTGDKIRNITTVGYIDPGMVTVPGETSSINNFQRESSVYIKTGGTLPFTHNVAGPVDNSRFTLGSIGAIEGQRVQRDISAYYASIKRFLPDQYGQIYSYESVDTGGVIRLDSPVTTIFGGDTFINRFGIKRKLPFFISNTVGLPNNTDVDYSLLGNVSYPTYYMSTAPLDARISGGTMALFDAIYNFFTSIIGGIIILVTLGIAGYVAVIAAMMALMGDILRTFGIKKVNLDKFEDKGFFLRGVMYLFAYGIPYYFVESDFNCDYRQASNGLDQNYFPNVGTDIPDYWLQEKNVSIAKDNYYLYNRDLSKQNIEGFYTTLPNDYDPSYNISIHNTRVINSEPYVVEELQNNWLLYKPNNYVDFTYNNGSLVSLKGIEQNKVLALFENNTAVYNAFITLPTDNKSAIIGDGSMFSTPPQEYSRTDIGYMGTQHQAFCSTEFGHFWIDAKRGAVFNLTSQGVKELTALGMKNWFKENLPFKILEHYPEINVDNVFKDFGIAICWDNRFKRLFITKKDYIPLGNYEYLDGKFYITEDVETTTTTTSIPGLFECCPDGYTPGETDCIPIDPPGATVPFIACPDEVFVITTGRDKRFEVNVCDPKYFCNASWTIAYTPLTDSWVSFYSFEPNFYVSQEDYFQSGIQCQTNPILWNHLLTNKSYQTFYNTLYPFEIEVINKPELHSNTLNSLSYRLDVLRYENLFDYRFMKDITFNQAIVSSTAQTSGLLDLQVHDKRNLLNGLFSTQNLTSISIPVSSLDNIWRFNKLNDVTKDANSNVSLFNYACNNYYKELNNSALDYSRPFNMLKKARLKSDIHRVKLINNVQARFKYIFKWIVSTSTKMIR